MSLSQALHWQNGARKARFPATSVRQQSSYDSETQWRPCNGSGNQFAHLLATPIRHCLQTSICAATCGLVLTCLLM